MEDRSATWAMGTGGIATRGSGVTDEAGPSGSYPRGVAWDGTFRSTRVVLACSHLDHDPTNNRPSNLKAFCQRCHMLHDRPEHQRRRWLTLFRRRALGDLYQGQYQPQ